ncbi:uncharacterized protein BcabD6B2_34520 [Babesia caballi]|uniref:Membrane protein, putative n=1 Tax=Babesia caballi TaxID=5871 RepID=A0AAV4LWJ3_BABCB|nr:membrane protein, putative [Babesia caballi]
MAIVGALSALLCACAAAVQCATGGGGLTLTPAQVLLPHTSLYAAQGSREALKIHVQVLLRVEPRVCVNWEVQNSDLLRLFPPNNEENYYEYSIVPLASFGAGCSSSIWTASVPSPARGSGADSGESLRTWVFAYDSTTDSRAGAEVLISPMRSIQFETRNRRISVNQIATLKIIGHDEYGNTFTSLEGIPFEARISDPQIMDIIDPRHDPDVATRARVSLLDKRDRFAVSDGYVLTSDVIVLQGRKVGRTRISVRVLLPEYRDIVLEDVEFTVSDSIDLEPGRLVLPPGVNFKFCVQKIKPQSSVDDSWDPSVDFRHYKWSTTGGAGQAVKADGTLTTGKAGGVDFRVVLTDTRNSESFASDVSVRVPASLGVSYGGSQDMLDCYGAKGADVAGLSKLPESTLIQKLQEQVYRSCRGGIRCGARYLSGTDSSIPPAYLLLGRSYVFDTGMRDKDGIAIYVPEGCDLRWRVADPAVVGISRSPNGRFALAKALREGSTQIVVETGVPKVSVEFSVSVTSQVNLVGFPLETVSWSNPHGARAESVVASTRPLVVPLNESAKLVARGGSGEYLFHVDDISLCSTKAGVLRCKAYGSTVLTVSDRLNPENFFKVQVVVRRVKRLEFKPSSLHMEVGTSAQLRLSAFADLSDVSPVFSNSWPTTSPDVGRFYCCMPLSYQTDSSFVSKVNCRVEHDRFMLDLTKVSEEPFACGVFAYRTLHPGDANVSVSLLHDEILAVPELTGSAKVVIYDRLSLSVHPDYSQFPFKTAPQPFMSVSQGAVDQSTFANVPIGGKVRLLVRGGPPSKSAGVVVSTCSANSAHLFVDKVEPSDDGYAPGSTMYDVYCMSETAGEKICVRVDGKLRNEYTIACRLPSYLEIHPLVPVNNKSAQENLSYSAGSPIKWEDGDEVSSGVFSSGSGLCYKNESKTLWQIKTNAESMQAFRAVVFDAFGTPLVPSHNYRVRWRGSAVSGTAESTGLPFQKIDNSVFVYNSRDIAERDLTADLEWPDAFDARHNSAKFVAVMKPKAVTAQIALSKMWKKHPDRGGEHVISTTLRLLPTPPHEILIGVNPSFATPSEKRVSIFFNPRMRYQFAVVLGSGNYVELTAYSESIKLQHSTTLTFGSAAEFAKAVTVMEGVTNLFDRRSLQKHLALDGKARAMPIPVKYMNFVCGHPCSRSLDIVDRGQLGQVTKTLIISQAPVSKLLIIVSDLPDGDTGAFEDFDALSSLQGGLNLLAVKRLYRLHAVALDADGVPMSYASLRGLKFSVCSNTLVKVEHPKDAGYESQGSAMLLQCLAEGKYTIRAEIRNFAGPSEVADGALVSESLEVTAYKETKPVLASILMLPNSGEFHLSMFDSALSRSLPSQSAVVESSDEAILQVLRSGHVGVIQSLKPGSCTLTSYIPGVTSPTSKSVTPVTVSFPYSVVVHGPSRVVSGKSLVLDARMKDSGGRIFTPVFLMGASESANRSYCVFSWGVVGHGTFLEGGERLASVSGAGRGRVTLLATSTGSISVSLKASCRNLGVSKTLDLVAAKFVIDAVVPAGIFGSPLAETVTLAPGATYEGLTGVVENVASSDKDLLTTESTNGNLVLRTEGKTGHVLLRTPDGNVSHVQVRTVDQLHVQSGGTFSGEINVIKSGRKELTVLLKTKDGQAIVPPADLRLKYMLSHASLFRVTLAGPSVHVSANSFDGCSSLMVLLDANDEQFTGANMVVDTVRLCVANPLTPQDAAVPKGSAVRFLSGETRTFSVQLRGMPLAQRYSSLDHQDSAKYYQEAISARVDSVLAELKTELSRGILKVFLDLEVADTACSELLRLNVPFVEVSQHANGLKAVYVFPFSICRDVNSAAFTAKLTSILHEIGSSDGGILSLMEGGVSPIFDGSFMSSDITPPTSATAKRNPASHAKDVTTSGWSVDKPDVLWMKDSHGIAMGAGSAVVKYDAASVNGDARIEVFDAVSKVEYQHFSDSMEPSQVFTGTLVHKEFNEPYYVMVKATATGGALLQNTLQVDSKVMVVCELRGSDGWMSEVFLSESTFVPWGGAGSFLPACRVSVRSFGGSQDWPKLRSTLQGVLKAPYGVKLRVSLYTTRPSDPKMEAHVVTSGSPEAASRPLWVNSRAADAKLWEATFDWKLPMLAKFVNAAGTAVTEVSVEPGKAAALSVYPHYSHCKLSVDSAHYKVHVTERQGLLCSFSLGNDGVLEPTSVRLVCQRAVAAAIKVTHASTPSVAAVPSAQAPVERPSSRVDLRVVLLTAVLATVLTYVIYTLLHRPAVRYYESTEPIKIERRGSFGEDSPGGPAVDAEGREAPAEPSGCRPEHVGEVDLLREFYLARLGNLPPCCSPRRCSPRRGAASREGAVSAASDQDQGADLTFDRAGVSVGVQTDEDIGTSGPASDTVPTVNRKLVASVDALNGLLEEYYSQVNENGGSLGAGGPEDPLSRVYLDATASSWPTASEVLGVSEGVGHLGEALRVLDRRDALCRRILAVQHCRLLACGGSPSACGVTRESSGGHSNEQPSQRDDCARPEADELARLRRMVELYKSELARVYDK